jgi:hypothetical protein
LPTCAPIANRRKRRGLATRAQDDILPHKRDTMIACVGSAPEKIGFLFTLKLVGEQFESSHENCASNARTHANC